MDDPNLAITAIRALLKKDRRFVLFEHGTVVVVEDDTIEDPESYATLKLEEDTEVVSGSGTGDMSVDEIEGHGWVVGSHDPDIFTFVPLAEMNEGAQAISIGMAGRAAHGADVSEPNVVHVEE